jgi:alkyl sulfatase BDS1-like metallo-beta-lactamase superfamily hydrolase
MWICNKSNRLNNTLILTKLTQNVLINKNPAIDFTTLSFDISNISKVESPTGIAYYEVLVRKTTEKAAFELYKYNEFFQLIQ